MKPAVLAIGSLLIGLGFASALLRILDAADQQVVRSNFISDVNTRANALEREVLLNLEIQFSLRGAFDLNPNMSVEEFDLLTQAVLERSAAIQAFAWAPRIDDVERSMYERRNGTKLPEFSIWERGEDGSVISARPRNQYFPVYFIEPIADNAAAIGFDLSTEALRLQALELARDSGQMTSTGGIRLVQETGDQRGFLVFSPIYEGQPTTVNERRAQLRGFFNGVFRLGDMFEQALGENLTDDIFYQIVDRTDGINDVLLEFHAPDINQWNMDYAYTRSLAEVAGRQWDFHAIPSSHYIQAQRSKTPQLVFWATLVITALLVSYGFVVMRKNAQLNAAKDELERISLTDSLTGIANRRHFDLHLAREWQRAARTNASVSLLMIDIDFFKPYNDALGHVQGDECLVRVAQTLLGQMQRPTDLLARYGGEEFGVILPSTTDANAVAEACRQGIEQLKLPHPYSAISSVVTISIGVATQTPQQGGQPEQLLAAADQALYRAKEEGRNRIIGVTS